MDTASRGRLDKVLDAARRERERRELGYRERALKIYPWVCGRCARTFTHVNLRELTVHHRDHNHDNNPPDGSNWELLCLYCHDNEHQRQIEAAPQALTASGRLADTATNQPFGGLEGLLKGRK